MKSTVKKLKNSKQVTFCFINKAMACVQTFWCVFLNSVRKRELTSAVFPRKWISNLFSYVALLIFTVYFRILLCVMTVISPKVQR